jgi:hypothetical protein
MLDTKGMILDKRGMLSILLLETERADSAIVPMATTAESDSFF